MSATLENLSARVAQLEQQLAQAQDSLSRSDNVLTGLMGALTEVLPALMRRHPDVALEMARLWGNAARDYQREERKNGEPELYEARKILANLCLLLDTTGEAPGPVRGQ